MPLHIGGLAVNELVERWKNRAEKLYADADACEKEGNMVEASLLSARALIVISMAVELMSFIERKNEQS